MSRTLRNAALFAGCSLMLAGLAHGQTGSIAGNVKGEDGKPLQGAQIRIERKDIKGNYSVKTNKKGEFFHAGLPLGNYKVSLEISGRIVDTQDNVRTTLGDPKEVHFDLQATKQRQVALQRAAETGQFTDEQKRDLSPEQRAAIEKAMKERGAQMAKNKALNDAFNGGMTAMQTRDYPAAIESFNKAAELDPKQHVIWANLAESWVGVSNTKTGPERDEALSKASENYVKALELRPDDAGMHNNYALALAKMKKIPEATAELEKAATLDPPGAGKYFYNLGAVLVNTGQSDAAIEAFKKAIQMDPNYAEAQFQYATSLSAKMQTTADGKVIPPPGMKEALEKYLELAPTGPNADGAKGLLMAISASVETSYTNPDAKKAPAKKKK